MHRTFYRVVTKPVVGICDLASNVTVGLRETTTLFEEGALVKERLPRYTGKDGTLRVKGNLFC
jgi:vacuolar protein sorting-associated protein 13A/C